MQRSVLHTSDPQGRIQTEGSDRYKDGENGNIAVMVVKHPGAVDLQV